MITPRANGVTGDPQHTNGTSPDSSSTPGLRRGLTSRHIHFIALGSAIGTGLFYGSASAISSAGPAVLLAYLLGGGIVYLVLRALGEMAVAHPVAGSFAEYARRYLGPWAGYITGWTYAVEMLVVALADVTAFALYMGFWWPGVPAWTWVVVVIVIIGGVNLVNVTVFGELEFAFSSIKVFAIIAMILGGAAILFTGVGTTTGPTGISNLWEHGGFAPNGLEGVALSLALVMFAFGGTEIIGVTAGEAQHPERTIPRAVNTVPLRILLFYVLSLAVILSLVPWSEIDGDNSPFVQIFSALGLPWAASLLNVVVLTAALSAINSDIFGAGRVLYGLSLEGLAPRALRTTDRHGVPIMTVAFMLATLIAGAVLNYLFPEGLFVTIAVIATFATVFVWLMILLAHLSSRRLLTPEEKAALRFPVPARGALQWVAVVFILALFVIIGFMPDERLALVVGLAWIVIMTAIFVAVRGVKGQFTPAVVQARGSAASTVRR